MNQNRNRSTFLRMRVVPLLGIVILLSGIITLSTEPAMKKIEAGFLTFGTVFFYISTLLFAGFSLISLILAIQSFTRPVWMIARIYAVLNFFACSVVTIFLWYWDIIGLRLWRY